MKKILGSLLRHVLSIGGGAAVATGGEEEKIVGLAAAAIGAVWSLINAIRATKQVPTDIAIGKLNQR